MRQSASNFFKFYISFNFYGYFPRIPPVLVINLFQICNPIPDFDSIKESRRQ